MQVPQANIVRGVAFALAMTFAMPLQAAWHKAESENFVIYADDSEKDVRKFAESLERYHSALELISGRDIRVPSPSNRVTIFAVGGESHMRRLSGSSGIAGFYVPRAGASKAFVQDIQMPNGRPNFSTTVLLHEYAHHFFIGSSRFAMPRWMSEGGAEFYAAAAFDKDGTLSIGRPSTHRSYELSMGGDLSARDMLDPTSKEQNHPAFYGRSWLLYHYLMFDADRKGQLQEYWTKLIDGQPSLEAAESVFGDLDELNIELRKYYRSNKFPFYDLSEDMTQIGRVTVTELSEGEAKMMPIRIRSQRGVDAEEAADVLKDARKVAERYGDDPGVLTALAEAEYDAGNNAEAIAAADAAIALDPNRVNAYVQKGYALFRMAGDAEDKEAAYTAAMAPFSALNSIEKNHPLPLIFYYRSFMERGVQPTENALNAIAWAAQLAPFDQDLWLQVAMMYAGEGNLEQARVSLQPLTADPHGGRASIAAKAMMQFLADRTDLKDMQPADLFLALQAAVDTAEAKAEEEADKEGES